MACPCFYMYRRETLPLFAKFVAGTKTLKERDAPGNFLTWLHPRSPVYALQISGRFDIGGLQSYIECEEWFQQRKKDKGKDKLLESFVDGEPALKQVASLGAGAGVGSVVAAVVVDEVKSS